MIDEKQVKNIVNKILKEEHLTDFIKIFEKEHNIFRGSHDKIALPENLEVPEKIITQIIKYVDAPATFKELEDTDIPEHLTGDFVQYDEGIEKWKRMAALTDGSILFADADGYFTEDNVNLVWNDTLKVLEVLAPTQNIYIGKGVIGAGNSTSIRNVFIGYEAGRDNEDGGRNVFIGYWAGLKNTSGGYNTLVGYYTSNYLTAGYSNTCVGAYAGQRIGGGYGNTCLGVESGQMITAGFENVILGKGAASSLTTGYRDTCLGVDANVSAIDSQYRIAIGYGALASEDNLCAIGGQTAATSVHLAIFENREFRWYDNGNYVGFEAPALDADQIWVLPAEDADAANKCLKSDGSGNLGWSQPLGIGDDPTFATLFLASIKSGATQVAAGAAADELWKTSGHGSLPDNVVMIGV